MSTPELWTAGTKILLKAVIREKGFTQRRVQEALGWGRSYISQALRGGKELRFDVVMQILFVIGVEPRDFFARLAREVGPEPEGGEAAAGAAAPADGRGDRRVAELRRWLTGLARLLVDHRALPANDVEAVLGRKLAAAGRRRAAGAG